MIVPHTFDEENHRYHVEGRYCLSTSDVIDLNGLSDLSMIPIETLERACWRGRCLHKAVERYELGEEWQDRLPADFHRSMDGWFSFRDRYDVRMVGAPEFRYTYLQGENEYAIGGTIDARFLWDNRLWICDLKTIYPLSGKALKLKKLAWRLQTESYKTPTEMDEPFLKSAGEVQAVHRCIVHVHPELKPYGFVFHPFEEDDSRLWDAAVSVAMAKIAAGVTPTERRVGPFREMLEASCA